MNLINSKTVFWTLNFEQNRHKINSIISHWLAIVVAMALTGLPYMVNAQSATSVTITATGSLASLNTVYGTPSTSAVFNVSGTNLTAGILVTPPAGFEVSPDNLNSTFSNTITVGGPGSVAPIQIYVRLKATAGADNYSGNVVLSSPGATNVIVSGASGTVAKAQLNITMNNKIKVYGVSLLNSPGITAFAPPQGLKNGETVGSVSVTYGAGNLATAGVSTYSGSVVGSAATGGTFNPNNYNITYYPGNIVINPTPLTVTADNKTRPFGAANPVFTFTYIGFVNGENPSVFTKQPVAATTATLSSLPGDYPITVSTAIAANYGISYTPGTLTIIPVVEPITVPNTFTPNNDGINDTWDIKFLGSSYPHCTVDVFNRYGQRLFFSTGYAIAWDGRFNNENLPVGTYYYIINLGNGSKPLSGAITIIR